MKHLHPRHPDRLVGSKWSTVGDEVDFRHWEVSTYEKRSGNVVLFAILERSTKMSIPWRELRDREHWTPGWI